MGSLLPASSTPTCALIQPFLSAPGPPRSRWVCSHLSLTQYSQDRKACQQCAKPAWARGLCNTHYARVYRIENPNKQKIAGQKYANKNKEKIRVYQAAYRAAHAEKHKAYNTAYRERPENRTMACERTQAWYRANVEKARKEGSVRAMEWARKNPEKARARIRAWDKAHPEVSKARTALWRARKKGAEGKHSATEVRMLFVGQNGCCAVCRSTLESNYHKDHIVALSRGGSNWIENIQLLCPSCNHRKGTKDNAKFLREIGVPI